MMPAHRRRIYLMRHGHVNYRRDVAKVGGADFVELTEQGKGEALAAGEALSAVKFDRAYSSGLPRTRVTAEKVLSYHDDPVPLLGELPGMRELKGGGQGSQITIDFNVIAAIMQELMSRAHEPGASMGPEGELFVDAQARAVASIEGLLGEPGWQTALVVAHEGINRILLSWMTDGGLGAVGAFEQDTCCINVLDFDLAEDGGIKRKIVKAVNLTPYNWIKHGMALTSLEAIFEATEND